MKILIVVSLLASLSCFAEQITLAWDPSPDAGVASYRIHYGEESGIYTSITNAGAATNLTISDLTTGLTYFFSATAVGTNLLESDFSNEISYTVPFPNTNALPLLSISRGQRYLISSTIIGQVWTNEVGQVFPNWTNNIYTSMTNVVVSWPSHLTYLLQYKTNFIGSIWFDSPTGTNNPAYFPISLTPTAFFRLADYVEPPITVDTNLILSLNFDSGAGNVAYDLSDNQYNGNLSNTAWVTRDDGFALEFDGSVAGVYLPPINVTGDSINIGAWIYPYSFSTSDGRIISKAFGNATQDHVWMLSTVERSGIKARFRLKTEGGTTSMLYGNTIIPDNAWTHIRGAYDGINMSIFINGTLDSSMALNGDIFQDTNTPVSIGINPNGYAPFHGIIDEVLIRK